jgi:hypothetical protein
MFLDGEIKNTYFVSEFENTEAINKKRQKAR